MLYITQLQVIAFLFHRRLKLKFHQKKFGVHCGPYPYTVDTMPGHSGHTAANPKQSVHDFVNQLKSRTRMKLSTILAIIMKLKHETNIFVSKIEKKHEEIRRREMGCV